MVAEIFLSDKLKLDYTHLKDCLQKVANRYMQGNCRYGTPKKSKRYMTRLGMEFKEYKKKRGGGNAEQLYNIIVYAILELEQPEHPNFHFDNTVDSVTRGRV